MNKHLDTMFINPKEKVHSCSTIPMLPFSLTKLKQPQVRHIGKQTLPQFQIFFGMFDNLFTTNHNLGTLTLSPGNVNYVGMNTMKATGTAK